MSKANAPVYRVKVSLKDSQPLIWRRFLVSSQTKLPQFHQMIQATMGWTDSHLHLFRVGPVTFTHPYEPGDLEEMTAVDERSIKLCHLVPLRRPFIGEFRHEMEYLYDFGDGWAHDIVFEDVLVPDAKQKAPLCLEGENTCPPENSGGISRWNKFVQSQGEQRTDSEPGNKIDMEEEDYMPRPAPFNLTRINQRLRAI